MPAATAWIHFSDKTDEQLTFLPPRCPFGARWGLGPPGVSLGVPLGPPGVRLRSSWGPPGVHLGTTFCYSQSEIYDIGTGILIFHCFATKILESFCKSTIFSGICSFFCVLYFCSIKTWFKALWDFLLKICMRPWIRSLSNNLPKRPLRDDFLATNMTFVEN